MPNSWTHMKFAEKVVGDPRLTLAEEQKPFLNLGAQGPDLFFYHNFWPWKKKKPVEQIGAAIHYQKCGPFLLDMIKEGAVSEDPNKRAYIMGFVTHHLLDRNIHPYIIYHSGEEKGKHQKLEIIIDTVLMQRHYDIKTWLVPVYKQLFVGKTLYAPIETMLDKLITSHFPDLAGKMPADYIDASYKNMLLAQRLLFDPSGWKNRLLGALVSPYSYTEKRPEIDSLNETKQEWRHPTDKNETHTESFYELMCRAVVEATQIVPLILDYWDTENIDTFQELTEVLGNLSYDTGKTCTLEIKNQYFSPII